MLRAPSDQPIIDPNDEYAFYQTLIGSWPASLCDRAVLSVESLGSFRARVEKTMLKLIREAKVYTRWSNPDREYEELVSRFVARALDASGSNDFLDSFVPWMAEVARLGSANSLIQLVLKMTIPGVPDIYQGAETWDFSMVDPDNRRPVDFVQNRCLSETQAGFSDMIRNWQSPGIKLFVTKRILDLRKEKPYLFSEGSYLPLSDLKMDRICAFVREHSSASILVAVLLPGALENLVDGRFSDLLSGRWKSILTEQTMQEGFHVGDLFQEAPFNVLLKV